MVWAGHRIPAPNLFRPAQTKPLFKWFGLGIEFQPKIFLGQPRPNHSLNGLGWPQKLKPNHGLVWSGLVFWSGPASLLVINLA